MNFGIVGCGFIAKKHSNAINNIEGANLIAICDKIPESMDFYVNEFDAKPYSELAEMLKNKEIDIVCICTPSGSHAVLTEEVAKAGKHIVLEKPIAMTLEETSRIINSCHDNQVKLAVVHPNRFRPVVQELRKIIDKGLLGKISHANATVNWNRNQNYYDQAPWRGTKQHDGGVLMNQAIHNLDLFLWFMGPVEQVFSMEATRLHNIEAEDVSIGVVRFESGALGVVEASTTVYSRNLEESITIFGEKGTVKIGGSHALYFKHLEIEGMEKDELESLKRHVLSDPWGIPGHQQIIDDLIVAIKEDRTPAITGEDGKRALELVLGFYRSAEQNEPINMYKGDIK